VPGATAPELKAPEELVVCSISWPVLILVMVTLAPLTTAPDGSVTVPTILPVPTVVCAISSVADRRSAPAAQNRRHRLNRRLNFFSIVHLPLCLRFRNEKTARKPA